MNKVRQFAFLLLFFWGYPLWAAVEGAQLTSEHQAFQVQLSRDPQSLLQSLKNAVPETDPVHQAQHALLLSQAYFALTYPHQANEQAELGLTLLNSAEQPWLYQQLKLAKALALDGLGTPHKGLDEANEALAWSIQQGDLSTKLQALYSRGLILISLVEYPTALADLQMAYDLVPQPNSIISIGTVAGSIALVYEYRREDELAIPFFQESVDYHEQHQEWIELSVALYGLGRANKNIGQLTLGKAQLQRSADLAKQVNDIQGVAYALKELAGLNLSEKNYDMAELQLLEAQQIFDEAKNPYMQLDVAMTLLNLALIRQQPEVAKTHYIKAKEYVDPHSMPIQKIALDELSAKIMALKGDYSNAYLQLQAVIKDRHQIQIKQSTEQLHQLRSGYELESQAQQNQLLERQNEIQYIKLNSQRQQNSYAWALFGLAFILCVLLAFMVLHNRKNKRKLLQLANLDSLTGLLNRRKTLEMLQPQFELSVRHKFDFCIVLVDLDFFKKINDQYGHAMGDKVLELFGRMCRQTFRYTDIVGRVGGEEFVIALPHTKQHDAEYILVSLRDKFRNLAVELQIEGLHTSLSGGLSVYTDQAKVTDMLAQADDALYRAKQQGRDRVEIYMPTSEVTPLMA